MLNSTSINQEEIILKSSSRKVIVTDQFRDLESGPIYRQKRSSKRAKLSLVSNQPITQKKLCYLCRKGCDTKMCKCENILYHPDCVLSSIKKSTLSLQTLQCPFCLCFFCTEIKNQKCHQRLLYRNISLFLMILIVILIIVMGVMWNHLTTIQILLIFIIILLLTICTLYCYRKIRYFELEWKLIAVDTHGYDSKAQKNAKLIIKANSTQTAQYILETEAQ